MCVTCRPDTPEPRIVCGCDYHSWASEEAPQSGKIAFLFLIYHSIFHEDVWRDFLGAAKPSQWSVFVHAKSRPSPLGEPFESAHLPHDEVVSTEYAQLSLVRAMNALLRRALLDPANTKFVFVSDACIPVKPFRQVYDALMADDCSHFSQMNNETENAQHRRQVLLQGAASRHTPIARHHAVKASQWCVLNRSVAQLCCKQPEQYVRCYEGVKAPEEWFYLTTARRQGLGFGTAGADIDTPVPDLRTAVANVEGHHCGPTFANWHENEDSPQGWRPKTYYTLTRSEIYEFANSSPCWFARKFALSCKESLAPLRALLRGQSLY